jgi:hypothetical protein
MKKNLLNFLFFCFLLNFSFAQNLISPSDISFTKANKTVIETEKRGIPSSVYYFEEGNFTKNGNSYIIKLSAETYFTCFGVAWEASNPNIPAGNFKISYFNETKLGSKEFGKEKNGEGENIPEETPTGLYWSELFFSYDETARKEIYLTITAPEGVSINKIRLDLMDLSNDVDPKNGKEVVEFVDKAVACPEVPTFIQRSAWCGTYTACTNATYAPTVINATHTVIHHGASPDTYTDGYAVVRSYWNYHVNSLGWSDIGYNYLIDKFGNLFIGRKNANYLTSDVRGSHAGNSNAKSIGVNFLGNGDVTQPTTAQLNKLYTLLAWWYKRKALDPLSSADIILQSGGNGIKSRICGHKDVNIGGTACPGTTIYGLLGTIRTQTASIINACVTPPVSTVASNLNRTVAACPTNTVNFSWTNSGTGWYIQVSTSSNFSSPFIKYVSGLTTFTGPTGFVLQSDGTTPLSLVSGQTYYWRIWDNTSFKVGSSFSLTASPATPGLISGNASACSGTTATYSIAAVPGASSYTWSVPSGSSIISGQGTTSISVSVGSTAGNISVSATNSCGTSALKTLAFSPFFSTSQPGTISGTASICSGSSTTYSISAVSGATSYIWTVPAGYTVNSGQGTTSVSITGGTSSGSISVSSANTCGTSSPKTKAITISTGPAQPGTISGLATICSGATSSYSISAVSGALSYTWTVPLGYTINSGQGTTAISVTGGTASGSISVSATSACGTSSPKTKAITISTGPAQPGTISGSATICSGATSSYSISAVSGALSYTWTVPLGYTINSGQGTTSISVTGGTASGSISVSATSACGTGAVRTKAITISTGPSQPGTISGLSSVCSGLVSSYSVTAVTGATSYTWTVPSGYTITAGQGTNSITITAGSVAGNISVTATSACGTSTVRTKAISISALPPQPGTISGLATICSGASTTYSITAISGVTTYNWTVPSGSTITSGQGTNSITITAGSVAGNVSVSATNSCGTSNLRTKAITISTSPAQPGTITGLTTICSGVSTTYSISAVSGATTYTWTVPSGSTITAGQETTSVTVTAGSTSGDVSVSASNTCGTSAVQTLAISATTCGDVTKPLTAVTNPNWVKQDFTATFTDSDELGGSGLKYKFYQVTDLNGTERRANSTFGFFNDNFNSLHADWTSISGSWAVANGVLTQSDEVNANSNLYAAVNQTSGNQYLYAWKMKISGAGTNRRAGLHFFCEDATQSNRLNSYMVYFRADGNTAQIYEYLNNVMYLRAEVPCTVNAGVQYDYKVILNTVDGEINVYQNNVLVVSWTDTTPLTLGNQVSLRTGECSVEYDDFRVFKSRTSSVTVTAGNALTNELRYQNATATTPTGQIVSITSDVAKNISLESSSNVNLDFYGPYIVAEVRDGLGADISTQTSTTTVSGNWPTTTDPNNTVTGYSYAIGTAPGTNNIVNWTPVGTSTSFTKTGLSLTVGTTYYISERSVNLAGIQSSIKSSNGFTVVSGLMPNDNVENQLAKNVNLVLYPNPSNSILNVDGIELGTSVRIIAVSGEVMIEKTLVDDKIIDVSDLNAGIYFVSTIINGNQIFERFIKE